MTPLRSDGSAAVLKALLEPPAEEAAPLDEDDAQPPANEDEAPLSPLCSALPLPLALPLALPLTLPPELTLEVTWMLTGPRNPIPGGWAPPGAHVVEA